ncbi:hypothetical protein [Phenylobacterium sp.]|uniref:DUF7662 domain-containing protein n=1 Tax=Phenylobacterium sp. TaxID=1871053 RepID=UPI0025E67211|nr:hypothetical protein [Phenylobacterium sp.]MBX3482926.1 hypothetical protein [Phenylobacterium sp.]MCW5759167.1 hypothetical protein [Phenylobacterium sp.]
MGRYEPLGAFLAAQVGDLIPLTFREIEDVLGAPLPASKRYPAWWSNNPSNNPMTKAWLAAGFTTEQVDIAGERLVFRRAKPQRFGVEEQGADFRAAASAAPPAGWLEKLREEMRGTVWIEPGYDLTQPAGEVWNAEHE